MARPKGLRSAEEVVPKLGIKPGLPALRVGDVAIYDRPIEHLAGHLDRSDLEVPVRVTHADGAIWVAVWKRSFERAGAPSWEEMQSAGLATGWVDNKVLSLGDEVYATRFARRRRPPPR